MKKLLFLVFALSISLTSFANSEIEKTALNTSQPSVILESPEWLLITNESGSWLINDGNDCLTHIWNCDEGGGVWSNCND